MSTVDARSENGIAVNKFIDRSYLGTLKYEYVYFNISFAQRTF